MSTIITRAGKGSPLTNNEVDANFTNLNTDKAELSGATFTGDVGIGVAPSELLHIESATTSPAMLIKAGGQSGSTTPTAELILSSGSLSSNDSACKVISYRIGDYSTAAVRTSGLKFQTTNANAPVDAMSLDNSGNLFLSGKVVSGTGATAAATLNAYSRTVSTNLPSALRVIENTGASSYWDIGSTGGASNNLNFYSNANTTPKMTITGAGDVSITSGNLDVTGTATMDGLVVDANTATFSAGTSGDMEVVIQADTDNNDEGDSPSLVFKQDGGNTIGRLGLIGNANDVFTGSLANALYIGNNENANLQMYTNLLERLRISNIGDISFYEDTGTTAKLTWDASAESLNFADNGKATFGAGSDLQIYSDGDSSYLKENSATGSLFVDGDNIRFRTSDGSKSYALFTNSGSARLYHDNSIKIETTSTGIDVTGKITVDSLGSIGVVATDRLYMATSDGLGIQLDKDNNRIVPVGADGSTYNNNVSLGSSGLEFKNLFLSGTATMDGLVVDGNATFTTADNTAQLTLVSTDTDALVGPQLNLWRNSGAGTNGDLVGEVTFTGEDTVGSTNTFATISAIAEQTNNGAEDGSLHFKTLLNGTLAKRLSIGAASTGGDISFYEDTGTTPKFYWDASAEGLAIGHSAPDGALDIEKTVNTPWSSALRANEFLQISNTSTTGGSYSGIELIATGVGAAGAAEIVCIDSGSGSGDLAFSTRNSSVWSEKMRITSGGILEFNDNAVISVNDTADSMYLGGGGTLPNTIQSQASALHNWQIGASNVMRIESAGNLLVGTTLANPTSSGVNVAGQEFSTTGGVRSTVASNAAATFNRKTDDGGIVLFRKDGSTVGSIGSSSGVVSHIVLDPRTAYKGAGLTGASLSTSVGILNPTDKTGAIADNAINLGNDSSRFRDLYLSGGVVFGATGGSVTSKTLDDYEEGGWTPSFTAQTTNPTVAYNTQLGTYTKIGNVVTAYFRIITNSVSGGAGLLQVSGLPFTVNGTHDGSGIISFNFNWSSAQYPQQIVPQSSSNNAILYRDAAANLTSAPSHLLASGNSYLFGTLIYIAS